ncbi:MAG: hypothetical protein ACI9VR_003172 [Cognaticolwellia sp.]|jgi:hypothetical protein
MLMLLFACASPDLNTADTGSRSCNGDPSYCVRPFDQVAVVGTHNSMSSAQDEWFAPNQNLNVLAQLELGVRALNLDVYEEDGELLTCHGYCALGSRPLVESLSELRSWLNEHPDQVLSLTFESYITPEQMVSSFESSGLAELSFERDPSDQWPTLDEMIQANTRLVVWTDSGGGNPGWYLDINQHAWETNYAYKAVEDFDCAFRRGSEDQSYVILAHFLTSPLASEELSAQANAAEVLRDRVSECEAVNRRPNLVLVDFVDLGQVFDVVAEVNQSWVN